MTSARRLRRRLLDDLYPGEGAEVATRIEAMLADHPPRPASEPWDERSAWLKMLEVVLSYVTAGARAVRLDAVAFLWKVEGTSSINLPETHAIVRLGGSQADGRGWSRCWTSLAGPQCG